MQIQHQQLDIPVLFLIFNRPDLTKQVFGQIREVQPRKLFIACDGPRIDHPDDQQKCANTRMIVMNMIDWDCEVKTLFRDKNLGCGLAVSQAITWFFDHVEMGIILEDDCYPDLSFFPFCSKHLSSFRNDSRVMMISGLNQLGRWKEKNQDYHFTYFGGVWGWATWKSCWDGYDINIAKWSDDYVMKIVLDKYFRNTKRLRKELYNKIYNGEIDTWDIQWGFHRLVNSGLTVIPSKNLIKNLGFAKGATHTTHKPHWVKTRVYSQQVKKVNHIIVSDPELDEKIESVTSEMPKKRNRIFKI